ncbi:MAG TPA: ribosome small subunit-dependent GTPase A [Ignavibacteriaceae bacterium]|nr:ribosome small subunit-dependent GTPase A [Ignavibacteriaceae bacterium]
MKIKGLVLRVESKDYYIYSIEKDEVIRSALRGKFKKDFNLKRDKLYLTDIAVAGDIVDFELQNDGTGYIHNIRKRRNYLSRKAPRIKGAGYRGERLEQVVAANIDELFIVSSVYEPDFNNKVIDRFLISGESSKINVSIIINKTDLDKENFIREWAELYKSIGYKVYLTSAITNEGIKRLKSELKGKINLFWGHSGVGKSSLLNVMFPSLNLRTGSISTSTDKGTHTTVTSEMIKVKPETYIIDTPGIREVEPYGVRKEDLGHYFPEFVPFINHCKFNTCTHDHEPGCAIIEAVEEDKISPYRYDSYLKILETIEQDIIFR